MVVPAILEDNLEGFEDKLAAILKVPSVHRIQIDFSDGIFTSKKTLEISDLDLLNPAYFWEAHLMLQNPSKYFMDAKIAGFKGITIHFEAVKDKNDLEKLAAEIRAFKISPGLAINPETAVEKVFEFLPLFDQLLILSVHPGYQGQEFLPETYARITSVKKHAPAIKIEVDGAIKFNNISKLAEAGADMFVVGSAIFDSAGAQPGAALAEIAAQNYEKLVAQLKK